METITNSCELNAGSLHGNNVGRTLVLPGKDFVTFL